MMLESSIRRAWWVCRCRAEELVQILMHAFETETGIPYGQINLQTLHVK